MSPINVWETNIFVAKERKKNHFGWQSEKGKKIMKCIGPMYVCMHGTLCIIAVWFLIYKFVCWLKKVACIYSVMGPWDASFSEWTARELDSSVDKLRNQLRRTFSNRRKIQFYLRIFSFSFSKGPHFEIWIVGTWTSS